MAYRGYVEELKTMKWKKTLQTMLSVIVWHFRILAGRFFWVKPLMPELTSGSIPGHGREGYKPASFADIWVVF